MGTIKRFISGITRKQNTEFGLVAILVVAILAYWLGGNGYLVALIVLALVTILAPGLFTPFAAVWYKLSHALGKVISSILLGIIFLLVVTPVAWIRRLSGKDSLALKRFKKGKGSVFVARDHTYIKEDLQNMF